MNSTGWGGQPPSWSQNSAPSYWGSPQTQPTTNKIYVISLEDALSRSAPRGSEMVYFHQDRNEFYVVKTDVDGRKSWLGFPYSLPNQDENTPATKADLKDVLTRLERLEKGGLTEDGKSDG